MACNSWAGDAGCVQIDGCPDYCTGFTNTTLHAAGDGCADQVILTHGFLSYGDHGGGKWYWDASADKTTADLGTIMDTSVGLTLTLQGTGSGTGCWVREYDTPVNVHWYTAKGDASTDDQAAIQATLDAAENNIAAVDVNVDSTASTANRNIYGGGRVEGMSGLIYVIKDSLEIPPRVTLQLSTIRADAAGSWSDTTGDGVDWITITNGGSGYTSVPTVTFTGGGGSGAAAAAVVSGEVVVGVYVTNEGSGYTSAPTIGFTGGAGSNAAATSELIVIGQGMITQKTPAGVYTTYRPGLTDTTLDGNAVADGVVYTAVKNMLLNRVTVYDAKHCSYVVLGADQGTLTDCVSYSAGKYGLYGSYNWNAATTTTSNEINWIGFRSKWSARAEIRTSLYTNNWTFHGGTCRQNFSDTANGNEIVFGSGGGGHSLLGMKLEHEGSNPNPVIVTLSGAGYKLYFNASPNSPSVHYKWVHNIGANSVRVDMSGDKAIMNNRITNTNVGVIADDISPFQSDAASGIIAVGLPHTSDARLLDWLDWCRDMEGNDQGTGTKFLGAAWRNASNANLSTYDFEAENNIDVGNNIDVVNNLTVGNNATITADLAVTVDATISGDLEVTTDSQMTGDLNVDGGITNGVGNYVPFSDGTTVVGTGTAGAGAQYVELSINGTVYKLLHDGTV